MTGDPPFTLDNSRSIQVGKTSWYDRFFTMFKSEGLDDLLQAVNGFELDVDHLTKLYDLKRTGLSGWVYWLLYLKGYSQYVQTRCLDSRNVYIQYLYRHAAEQRHDPGLAALLRQMPEVVQRTQRRFEDAERLLGEPTIRNRALTELAPLTLVVRQSESRGNLIVYLTHSEQPLRVNALDGFHRLFLARLAGVPSLRCRIVTEHAPLRELVGHLSVAFASDQLKVSGWHQALKERVDGLELRLDGVTVGWTPYGGDDYRLRTMPTAPDGEAAIFNLHVPFQVSSARIATVEVVPAANFLPWGRVVGSVDLSSAMTSQTGGVGC
jgi:hypothetical protein